MLKGNPRRFGRVVQLNHAMTGSNTPWESMVTIRAVLEQGLFEIWNETLQEVSMRFLLGG